MILAALLVTQACWAQRQPSVPMLAISDTRKLTGANRIRYLLRQLDLDYQQRELARGLVASILDQSENQPFTIEQVTALMAEIQQKEADGDEEGKKQLEQQLRDLATGYDREDEFFMNMEPELTDEQKAKLQAARERLERNPSGALRPIDVVRAAQELDLTKEQQAQLIKTQKELRASLRQVKTLTDEKRFQLINGLLERIHQLLTDEQRPAFDVKVNRLRPDRVGVGLKARATTARPADDQQPKDPTGD
jgi:hypothetical protein